MSRSLTRGSEATKELGANTDVKLAEAIDANLRTRQRLHATEWPNGVSEEQSGVLLTRLPGSPHLQSAIAAADAPNPVSTAEDWYGDEPFTLWLPGEPTVSGVEIVEDLHGMALAVDSPPAAPSLDIRTVADGRTLDGFWSVATAFGLARATVERLFSERLLAHGTALVGFVADEPVAAGWSLPTGAVAGLYGVATAPAHRGRGYSRAIVAEACLRADAAGCTHVVLQTAHADDVFSAMGFTTVCRYRVVASALMRS